MRKLKVVSLFSGIGGFEEGLNLSGLPFEVVFASEIDKFAQQSYGANFDSSVLVGDITQIYEKDIPDHDLLVGGFPCQAFSIAGQQKGFEDTRGTLKNLINHDKGNTFEVILTSLKKLGYVIDFTVLNSKDFGVPQSRERTFICGIYAGKQEPFKKDKWSSKVDKLKQGLSKVKLTELDKPPFPSFNLFNTLNGVDKAVVLEDVINPSVREPYYQITKPSDIAYLTEFAYGLILPRSCYILRLGMLPREIHKNLEQHRRFHSVKGLAPTITARHESPRLLVSDKLGLRVRKMTETECFLAQGYPLSFVENIKQCGTSRNQMYKQAGNSVSPPVIAAIIKALVKRG